MKALVTGGAGFIGSHIVERLLNDGHSASVLDDLSTGREENLSFTDEMTEKDYKMIKGDICDYETCVQACDGADVVFHQAALKSVPKSMERPYDFNEVNINGILNMLRASKECGVKRFVFASSSSVYGNVESFPQIENAYPQLVSPYALTKLAGEYYLRVFSENYGLETISLRYFNVFGPRQPVDDEYSAVIPKFIECMLDDKRPPVFGNGKQSRDFTYIDNVVNANMLAATVEGVTSGVFNIALGKDSSLLELIKYLNEIIGKNLEPDFLPVRAGDVFKSLADISKAQKQLGFVPGIDFKEGLEKTVDSFIDK
ncbi:SDR family oxidoreductase [Elusimicrobiota bacterium]